MLILDLCPISQKLMILPQTGTLRALEMDNGYILCLVIS